MNAGDMSMLTESICSDRAAVRLQIGSERLDGLGIAPLGDEQHRALHRIGGQGDVVVPAGSRGLVDRQCVHVAEVGLLEGQVDVALQTSMTR